MILKLVARAFVTVASALWGFCGPLFAQIGPNDGGPLLTSPADAASVEIDWLHPQSMANARALGLPYLHMKNGTVTGKDIGELVATGEKLGVVGSSGFSTGPHLHFELRDESNVAIDPFAGACGATRSLWKHQWNAEDDFRLLQVATMSAPPVFASNCINNQQIDTDIPNFQNTFSPGDTARAVVFVRDQSPGDVVRFQVFDPSGTQIVDANSGTAAAGQFFKSAYWTRTFVLAANAPAGAWRVRGSIDATNVIEHTFFVGGAPASTSVVGAVLPGGRSVQTNSVATVFATVLNTSSTAAQGCIVQPYTPLNSGFTFQTTNPVTNAITGTPNASVDIPGNSAQSFVLAFNPATTSRVAEAVTTVLRMKCANADAAPVFEGVNTLLLSFDPNPVPDIIPVATTVSNDGVVRLPGANGAGFWAAASVNIGVNSTLTVAPEITGSLPITVSLCETNPGTGACFAAPAAAVSTNFDANVPHTYSIFVQAAGAVAFDPANARIKLNFTDSSGIVRGQTSVAVTTN